MAKGAGAKQSTKGSSGCQELQQQGPDDGGPAAYCCWDIIRCIRKKRSNFMGCSKLKVVIAIVCVCFVIYGLSIMILSPWHAVKSSIVHGLQSSSGAHAACQICSKNSRLVMISYNFKSHNIITKLQICVIFLQLLILWPLGSNSRRRRRRQ